LRNLDEDLTSIAKAGNLEEIPGIGKDLAAMIESAPRRLWSGVFTLFCGILRIQVASWQASANRQTACLCTESNQV
jgi:hypothetical protein